MKLATVLLALAFGLSAQAESTLTLEGIHNCCKSCENGLKKAVADMKDVSLTSTKTSVTITAKSKSDAKKAAQAILDAGYYGTSADLEAKAPVTSSTPAAKVKSATITDLHMCCQKCANAANAAIKSVAGVTKGEAVSKETSVTVEGEFVAADLLAAIQKAGFNGKLK